MSENRNYTGRDSKHGEKDEHVSSVAFSVDAGIINRLGKELVGRAETAVSELVKNSYDADANVVTLRFIDTDEPGGTLEIEDDGHGMNTDDLVSGFMRLSSSIKIHAPISPKYKRVRAGKKGIGRFATQRLGSKLVIKTKRRQDKTGIQLDIDWSRYNIDINIEDIYNPISLWETEIESGTILEIQNLYEPWTNAQIKRVFRYVMELLQPDYLSDRSKALEIDGEILKIATQSEGSFSVKCFKEHQAELIPIINEDKLVFERAVATIEGYIDSDKDGYCSVKSERFGINEEVIPISSVQKARYEKWKIVKNIYFKAYYFIYNRPNYYTSMSKLELKKINELSSKLGSIRLYRNGFRVLPYGEPYNDWLKLDSKNRSKSGVNAPLGNNNFFGFVEVIDRQGDFFEETASREGLLENDALLELRDFVYKALLKGRDLVSSAIMVEKENQTSSEREKSHGDKSTEDLLDEIEKISKSKKKTETETETEDQADDSTTENEKQDKIPSLIKQVKKDIGNRNEEIAMLRIWAGLGMTIGEFTHDVIQFTTALGGYLRKLEEQNLNEVGINTLNNLEEVFKSMKSYIAFFDTGASRAESRYLHPVNLIKVVKKFLELIDGTNGANSTIDILPLEIYDSYDMYTVPMHQTEWYSILFNLYSNSKKAIMRRGEDGKIKIILGKEEQILYLEFLDNGDGVADSIKDKIFDPFYSTSTTASVDSSETEELTGRGLGLKLIRDTLQVYHGSIELIDSPEKDFYTCFRIEVPTLTEKQKEDYGY